MGVTVEDLLSQPFSARSLAEKLKIVKDGKPRPLSDKIIIYNEKEIHIDELFDRELWLTACEQLGRIFCWTCLLFPVLHGEYRSFISTPTDENIYSNVLKHKKSPSHIGGLFQYRMFLKQYSQLLFSNSPLNDNQTVTNNKSDREVLMRVINTACFLVSVASPPLKATSGYNIPKSGDCTELVMALREYDVPAITDETINFIKNSPKILTDTVEAIAAVMKMTIKKEMALSSHVSLVLSEHAKFGALSKLSTILRYVYKGSICERFVELTNYTEKNDDKIKEHISQVISEFEILPKLLAWSCDGSFALLHTLSKFISSENSTCVFSPCYFHDFGSVLEQRFSSEFSECRNFFISIQSMKTFFQNDPKICDALNKHTKGKILDLYYFRLSNSQFLRVLKMYRREFITFFGHIEQNSKNWNADVVVKAIAFQNILEQYQTIFLIEVFSLLFSHVAVLNEMLSSRSPENVFNVNIFENIKDDLEKEKNNGFENLWTMVTTDILQDDCAAEVLQAAGQKETKRLFKIFKRAIDCIIHEIKVRFSDVHKLDFLSLLSCENHDKLLISDSQMEDFLKMHGHLLNKEHFLKEMKILRKNGVIFGGKSVYEFMNILSEAALQDAFKSVYKLAEIILTVPCKPVSSINGPSKLNTIDQWVSVANKPDMNTFSFLCVEKDYLEYLKSRTEFFDEVVLKLRELGSVVPAASANPNGKMEV